MPFYNQLEGFSKRWRLKETGLRLSDHERLMGWQRQNTMFSLTDETEF